MKLSRLFYQFILCYFDFSVLGSWGWESNADTGIFFADLQI